MIVLYWLTVANTIGVRGVGMSSVQVVVRVIGRTAMYLVSLNICLLVLERWWLLLQIGVLRLWSVLAILPADDGNNNNDKSNTPNNAPKNSR